VYKPLVCSLLALLVTGCVGDGGGSARQGDVGTETPANQGGPFDVGNETPADQGGPFDVGPEEGGSSGPSGGQGDRLFELCMELCTQETGADYCREEVCDDLDDGGGSGPPGGGVNYCEDDERELLEETFSDACVDCICSSSPATIQTACSDECGF